MKKIISLLIITIIAISMCSCTGSFNKNIDEKLIETSNSILEFWGTEEGRTFSVVVEENDIYRVDINGKEMLVEIEKDYVVENTKSNITECDSEVMEIVKASKELVIEYINESDILKDKDELVNYINNIPVMAADWAGSEAVEYDSEYDKIFINNQNRVDVCAYTITHELVYTLCQKTNGGVENMRYHGTIFNEVITEMITYRMHPETIDSIYTKKYVTYTTWVELYFGCVGIEGIEAYFYGYDEILEWIPEAELDIFVQELKYEEDSEDAVTIICCCINEWGLEK